MPNIFTTESEWLDANEFIKCMDETAKWKHKIMLRLYWHLKNKGFSDVFGIMIQAINSIRYMKMRTIHKPRFKKFKSREKFTTQYRIDKGWTINEEEMADRESLISTRRGIKLKKKKRRIKILKGYITSIRRGTTRRITNVDGFTLVPVRESE